MQINLIVIWSTLLCLQIFHYAETVFFKRSFEIDFKNNGFLKDGRPFRYVSGDIHYFRIPRPYWRDRLRKYRAAGLNVISVYVEWSTHEPRPRQYCFTGQADVEYFIQLAVEEGLLVILRPGPYICAERDMGGFPFWLMMKYPKISLRTNDPDFQREVEIWLKLLMTRLSRHYYANGGPIILVQVENEYGLLPDCNEVYKIWIRDLIRFLVQDKAVLFSLDRSVDLPKGCGVIPGIYTTVDFGIEVDPRKAEEVIRRYYKKGPLVCTEFYTGWIDYWGHNIKQKNYTHILKSSKQMLDQGWSFNYYMFHGGTNFGFTNGASDFAATYQPQITSYDYDAPLDEAGDPTLKYYSIRTLLSKYFILPNIPVPKPAPKGNYGVITLRSIQSLFNSTSEIHLPWRHEKNTKSFEELGQYGGYVLYETVVPANVKDGALLDICSMHDRTNVYLNHNFIGILSRSENVYSISLPSPANKVLSLLVENQGRVSFGRNVNDVKGIFASPKINNTPLVGWKITQLPLDNTSCIRNLAASPFKLNPPAFYSAEFTIPSFPLDTYIDVSGWGKGVVFVNDINIGRYWPSVGPQVTLYLPGCYLRPPPLKNTITIFETELTHPLCEIALRDKPFLNKTPMT